MSEARAKECAAAKLRLFEYGFAPQRYLTSRLTFDSFGVYDYLDAVVAELADAPA